MKFVKPKFWDKKKVTVKSLVLLPFTTLLYFNNFLLNKKIKYKTNKIISICVGNIYLGGTGKTPITIELYKIFMKLKKKVVTAKKYYPSQIDEIELLKKKTKLLTNINRTQIIKDAIKKQNEIIIFDDGLQDRGLDYSLKFACFDSSSWVGNGFLLPAGPLREPLDSIKKYDCIFLKNIKGIDQKIIAKIKSINQKIKIFNYKFSVTNIKKFNLKEKYILFSGIGAPENLENLVINNKLKIIEHLVYPDHYNYSNDDISKILNVAKKYKSKVITTEKDYIKIPKIYKNKITPLLLDIKFQNKKMLINFLKYKINNQ